jgi:hypothetical protein
VLGPAVSSVGTFAQCLVREPFFYPFPVPCVQFISWIFSSHQTNWYSHGANNIDLRFKKDSATLRVLALQIHWKATDRLLLYQIVVRGSRRACEKLQPVYRKSSCLTGNKVIHGLR